MLELDPRTHPKNSKSKVDTRPRQNQTKKITNIPTLAQPVPFSRDEDALCLVHSAGIGGLNDVVEFKA